MRKPSTLFLKAGLFAAAVISATADHAQVPNTWTRKADICGTITNGPTARSGSYSFALNGKGYLGGGNDGTARNDFWQYDPATNVWTQKANVNMPQGAVGLAVGNFGYAGSGATNSFYRYDPIFNVWITLPIVGGSSYRMGAYSFSAFGRCYIGGGVNSASSPLNDFWEFNPSTNLWTQKTSPGTGLSWAAAMGIAGKGYLIARDSNLGTAVAAVKEYDPIINAWTPKSAFPGGPRQSATTFSFASSGLLCTGADNAGGFSDLWQYYPATDTWTQRPSLPAGIYRTEAAGFVSGTNAYLCTGKGANGVEGAGFAYDTLAQTWSSPFVFGKTRVAAVAFSINGKGYIGTGATSYAGFNELQNEFWMYDPQTNSWTQKANFAGLARREAVGFATADKGYIGMGRSIYGRETDFWEYDPLANAWNTIAAYPSTTYNNAIGTSIGNKGYVLTLDGLGAAIKWCEYDPQTNVWSEKTRLPDVGAYTSFSIGRRAYISADHFWEYNPDKDSWTQKLLAPAGQGIGFSIGGRGYIAGNKLAEYDPETDAWSIRNNYFTTTQINNPGIAISIGNYGYAGASLGTSFPISVAADFWQYTPSGIITAYNGIPICAEDTTPFFVPYFSREGFNSGNTFYAQLSDSNGSFASPTVLPPLSGSAPSQLQLKLPTHSYTSKNYKLRVLSTSPALIGASAPLLFYTVHPPIGYDATGALTTVSGYQSYQWFKDGYFVFGATSATFSPTDNGTYTVAARDASGCRGFSDSVVIRGLGVNAQSVEAVSCYPNPATDVLHFGGSKRYDVSMLNVNGALCKQAHDVQQLDVKDLPAGVYFLRLRETVSGKQYFVRIMKSN